MRLRYFSGVLQRGSRQRLVRGALIRDGRKIRGALKCVRPADGDYTLLADVGKFAIHVSEKSMFTGRRKR